MTEMAGWLRDPYGRYDQRFWDGRQWTSRVRKGSLEGDDPVDEQRPRPVEAWTPEEKAAAQAEFFAGVAAKNDRQRPFWIAFILVAAIAVLAWSVFTGGDLLP